MTKTTRSWAARAAVAGTAFMLLLPFVAHTQEEEGEPDIGADTTLIPRPSEMAPRAAASLLLDVVRAGSRWVAVGQRGIILLSDDGDKWQQVITPADVMLTRVRFLDDKRGWVVGYDGALMGTTDGGSSWSLLQFDAAWGNPYFDVRFFDENNGLLAGANGTLKRTGDGGKTWAPVETDVLADGPNLYNIVALSDGSLLIAGERGFLAQSADQGLTWRQVKSPYTGSYFGALPSGTGGALVFGLRGNAFHAPDVKAVATLTPEELEAIRSAAADPTNATGSNDPVSTVEGFTRLTSDDKEPLFGGAVGADGNIVLMGQNGRVMKVDLAAGALQRVPIGSDINMNAGAVDGGTIVTVGTSGIQRVKVQ